MKRMKIFLSGFIVLAIVSTALAFKTLESGSVYCSQFCQFGKVVAYRIDPAGTPINPCTGIMGLDSIPHYFDDNNFCEATTPGVTKFVATVDK